MKVRRLESAKETLGYCHDCHNRASIEITFAHRPPIRLCRRDTRFLIRHLESHLTNANGNGRKTNHTR